MSAAIDKENIAKVMVMFDEVVKLQYTTEVGKKFNKDLSESLEEIIKPIARDCYRSIK